LQLKLDNSKMENFKVIEEKENPLFNRKEIQFDVEAKITPNRTEIGKLISEKFSTQIENIKIKKIHGKFGSNNFNITTFIYKSEEDKNKLEIKKKKEEKSSETPKKVVEEKPKEEVASNEPKAEEKDAEIPKENNKVEENKNG